MSNTSPIINNTFGLFAGYRCYITPEAYLITYRDADFIKVLREDGKGHDEGFLLCIVEILFEICVGQQTSARERYALWKQQYNHEAKNLLLLMYKSRGRVVEFELAKLKIKVKGEME